MDGDDNNLARQYEAAQREQAATQAGLAGQDFAPRTAGERRAYESARGSGGRGSGALGMLIIGIGALGFWPICGAIGLGVGIGAGRGLRALLPQNDPRWALAWVLGGVIAGGLGLRIGIAVERALARFRAYRLLRHPVRLAWVGALITYGCVSARIGGTSQQWPDHLDWRWIDAKLTPGLYGLIGLGMLATHFLSRRFDRAVEAEVAPERAADRQFAPEDRARGMRLAFLCFGVAGALIAVVHGDRFGGIIMAAVVFGVVGALAYLLYRGARGLFRGTRRR